MHHVEEAILFYLDLPESWAGLQVQGTQAGASSLEKGE